MQIKASDLVVNISVTYRPLGQTQEHDAEMYRVLRQTLRNGESVILGDFSLPHIDWHMPSGVESESQRVLEFLEDNFLSQLVSEPTRGNNQCWARHFLEVLRHALLTHFLRAIAPCVAAPLFRSKTLRHDFCATAPLHHF